MPYLDVILESFGPDRLMFGSDWPVCLVACDYMKWVALVKEYLGRLSSPEKDAILSGNAVRIYRLEG